MTVRRVITVRDDDGVSRVIADGAPRSTTRTRPGLPSERVDGAAPPELAAGEGLVSELWRALPGGAPDHDATAEGGAFSLVTAPDGIRFLVTQYAPGRETPMHETPTVDYDFVLAGSITYLCEDGTEVPLTSGDAILVRGRHAWRAGADGASLGVVMTPAQ